MTNLTLNLLFLKKYSTFTVFVKIRLKKNLIKKNCPKNEK